MNLPFHFCFQKQHAPQLASDEVTTVRKNLEAQNVDVNEHFVSVTQY